MCAVSMTSDLQLQSVIENMAVLHEGYSEPLVADSEYA